MEILGKKIKMKHFINALEVKALLLEKLNETVWNVKRKNRPGMFEFRATEQRGEVKNIKISLIDEESERRSIAFDMDRKEFERFYTIISNFKKIIEYPEKMSGASITSFSSFPKEENTEEDPLPLSLDGEVNGTTIKEQKDRRVKSGRKLEEDAVNSSLDALDEGLASLEALDQDDSPISEQGGKIKKVGENKREQTKNATNKATEKSKASLVAPKVPSNATLNRGRSTLEAEPLGENEGKNDEDEDKLDPTEWDPW